nr:hypothetical protein [Angustibacter aerolatus]
MAARTAQEKAVASAWQAYWDVRVVAYYRARIDGDALGRVAVSSARRDVQNYVAQAQKKNRHSIGTGRLDVSKVAVNGAEGQVRRPRRHLLRRRRQRQAGRGALRGDRALRRRREAGPLLEDQRRAGGRQGLRLTLHGWASPGSFATLPVSSGVGPDADAAGGEPDRATWCAQDRARGARGGDRGAGRRAPGPGGMGRRQSGR